MTCVVKIGVLLKLLNKITNTNDMCFIVLFQTYIQNHTEYSSTLNQFSMYFFFIRNIHCSTNILNRYEI